MHTKLSMRINQLLTKFVSCFILEWNIAHWTEVNEVVVFTANTDSFHGKIVISQVCEGTFPEDCLFEVQIQSFMSIYGLSSRVMGKDIGDFINKVINDPIGQRAPQDSENRAA